MPRKTKEELEAELAALTSQGEQEYDIEIEVADKAQAQRVDAIATARANRPASGPPGRARSRALGISGDLIPKCSGMTQPRYETQEPKPCRLQAGHGTDHFGQGNCKYHGGAGQSINMKHGRYSGLLTDELGTLVDHFSSDNDPLNLEPDIALMRGLLEKWVSDYDKWYEIISAWHESNAEGNIGAYKPPNILAITEGNVLLAALAKMVGTEYKRRQNTAVSQIHLFRIVNEIGAVIGKHVTDEDTLKAIREEMLTIRFPKNVTG